MYDRELLERELLRFEGDLEVATFLLLVGDGYATAITSDLVIFPLPSLSYLDFELEPIFFSSSPSITPFLSESRDLK